MTVLSHKPALLELHNKGAVKLLQTATEQPNATLLAYFTTNVSSTALQLHHNLTILTD